MDPDRDALIQKVKNSEERGSDKKWLSIGGHPQRKSLGDSPAVPIGESRNPNRAIDLENFEDDKMAFEGQEGDVDIMSVTQKWNEMQ